MIITSGLKKYYGETAVVDDVSVELPSGGITSIIGPNGAGKSTMLSIVSRLLGCLLGCWTIGLCGAW